MHIFTFQSVSPHLGLTSTEMVMMGIIILLSCVLTYFLSSTKLFRQDAKKCEFDEKIDEARTQELEWHREKRFLMERQAMEKQVRLAGLIDSVAPENAHRLTHLAARLFFLAESIREERQHLGTDISKLALIDRRLRKLGKEYLNQSGSGENAGDWLSKMTICCQMIQSNNEDLRKCQNLLRNVLGDVVNLEEKVRANNIAEKDWPAVKAALEVIKKKFEELPDGLRTVSKSTAEQAQILFSESNRQILVEDLHLVWKEQTNMDLFSSKHRPGGRAELLDAAEKAISAFRFSVVPANGFSTFWDLPKEVPTLEAKKTECPPQTLLKIDENKESHNIGKGGANPFLNLIGDNPISEVPDLESTFSDSTALREKEILPSFNPFFEKNSVAEPADPSFDWSGGHPFRPKDEEKGATRTTSADWGMAAPPKKLSKQRLNPSSKWGEPLIPRSSLVVFRSHNPEIWNTTTKKGENDFAIALNEISGEVRWMSIKRIDTAEEVFCEITLRDILSNGEGRSAGFNGSNEYFYGANHLGFFSEECVTEVETRFTYGGWGFGHLSTSGEDNPEQICGWNGYRIPNGTVFEFTLFDEKPEWVREEQVIL